MTITASASELAMPSNDVARWRQSSKFGHAMPEPCCSARKTRRSASGYGSGRTSTAYAIEKIAVVEPMPRTSTVSAVTVKRGERRNTPRAVSHVAPHACRARSRGHHGWIRSSASVLPDRGGPARRASSGETPRDRCASISRSRWSRSSSAISPSIRRRRSSPRTDANRPGDHRPSSRMRRIDSAKSSQVSVS